MTERRRVHFTPYWRLFVRRWLATVVCVLASVTFFAGLVGFFWQHAALSNASHDWSIPILRTVQLFLLNSGAEDDSDHPSNSLLMIARLFAASLFLVVTGTVILRVLDEVRRLPSLLTRRNHVVICGLGQIGLQLLDDLDSQDRGKNVVVVENNPANPWIEYARNLGATVVIGDSTKSDTLAEARSAWAAEIFVVNGDDGVNLEVVAVLGILLDESKLDRRHEQLRVHVHVVDTNFATTLRPYCKVLHDSPNISVQVFNVSRTAAARLVTNQLWPYAPKNESEVAHLAILGFGAMGQALAVQLAQLGHFPNRKRSRFTIADREIEKSARSFLSRYPRFTSWSDGESGRLGVVSFSSEADAWGWNEHPLPDELKIDSPHAIQYACNAEFVELPVGRSDERFAMKLAKQFSGDGVKPVIFICGQQDRDNFEMAVQLRDQLSCQGKVDVPIFVWLPRQPALAETLSRTQNGNFIPFGECRSAASYLEITDPIRERIGQKIQAAYENREADKAKAEGQSYRKAVWSSIPDDHRESNRVAADHMLIKLRHVGVEIVRKTKPEPRGGRFTKDFAEKTRHMLAEMEHYRWVAERLLTGWRYIPKGNSGDEINAYKKRKLNHNITVFEKSEAEKDFHQIDVIYEECQRLDGFILRRLGSGESSSQSEA